MPDPTQIVQISEVLHARYKQYGWMLNGVSLYKSKIGLHV